MCYVKCQIILVNVLVHLFEHVNYGLRCLIFSLLKFASQLKLIQSLLQVGILGICITSLILRVLLWEFGVPGLQSTGHQSPGSRISGPDFRLCHLKYIRRSNLNKLIFAHLNINSIKNNFESVVKGISSILDLLMFSETKIDDSFPKGKFLIKGFGDPFRIDRNINGWAFPIMSVMREKMMMKRCKCLVLMLNLKVNKQTRSEANKNKVKIKRV